MLEPGTIGMPTMNSRQPGQILVHAVAIVDILIVLSSCLPWPPNSRAATTPTLLSPVVRLVRPLAVEFLMALTSLDNMTDHTLHHLL
jgi:hypothetical protein